MNKSKQKKQTCEPIVFNVKENQNGYAILPSWNKNHPI